MSIFSTIKVRINRMNHNYCTGSTTPYACCTGAGTGVCANAKQINVEVRWQWQGNYRQVALNTLIAP